MARLTNPLRYDNVNDVKMRLHGSVIHYRGVPVQVISLNDELGVQLASPTNPEYDGIIVHSSDVELDVSSVHVGWVNHQKVGPLYLMRAPWRQQKQGLSFRTLIAFYPGKGSMEAGSVIGTGTGYVLICKALAGQYKKLEDCVSSTNGGAFSKEWAIAKPEGMGNAAFVVYHKSVAVGLYVPRTKTFLFTRGTLSKTRRASLAIHAPAAGGYVVSEQS